MGESLVAMYSHQTTCEPPQPSLGRRIDLSEYRDLNFLQNLPQPSSPVSLGQTTVLSSSPSSSLPPVTLPEPAVLSQPSTQPQITPSSTTVEITTFIPPVGQLFLMNISFVLYMQKYNLGHTIGITFLGFYLHSYSNGGLTHR